MILHFGGSALRHKIVMHLKHLLYGHGKFFGHFICVVYMKRSKFLFVGKAVQSTYHKHLQSSAKE